jgi:hypothetical protein
MIKQFGLMLAAAFAAGTLLPGCAFFAPKPAAQALEPMTANERNDNGFKAAKEYMDNFTAAFRDKDIEKFKLVISEDRRKKLTPEIFNEILAAQKREQGEFVNMELVAVLDQVIYQTYLWKMTYEKKNTEGKPVRRDFLYFVSIGKVGDNDYAVGAAGYRL